MNVHNAPAPSLRIDERREAFTGGSPTLSVNEVVSAVVELPLDTPISVSWGLTAFTRNHRFESASALFDNSLGVNVSEVFGFEGNAQSASLFTANSESWGLVDNQLPNLIPEPSSLAVWLLLGAVVAGAKRCRKRGR